MNQSRQVIESIFQAAIQAVQPHTLLPACIQLVDNGLLIAGKHYSFSQYDRIQVIGAGKASAAMAQETEKILGDHLTGGLVVTKYEHALPLQKIRLIEAGHPVPDIQSVAAGNAISRLLQKAGAKDLIICLISGGGSSLLADFPPGSSLEEMQALSRLLLENGVPITGINTIRKHLSSIKGGGLALQAHPATLVSLLLSDVIGDPPDMIASGPTVPDSTSFADAWQILEQYTLQDKIPVAIRIHLENGLKGTVPETAKPDHPAFEHTHTHVIGNNALALEAARKEAVAAGYETILLTDRQEGEARDVATALVEKARSLAPGKKYCLLAGGETTVTLKGSGKGGRNQELALAAALTLDQLPGITLGSCGTDGTDGPTDAAGAIVDQETQGRARTLGLDAQAYLNNNDAYHFFQQTGGLIKTGPTQTNVMDVMVVLRSE